MIPQRNHRINDLDTSQAQNSDSDSADVMYNTTFLKPYRQNQKTQLSLS